MSRDFTLLTVRSNNKVVEEAFVKEFSRLAGCDSEVVVVLALLRDLTDYFLC